ncbi:MAG: CCA tRNA nucleotidyltransferase [Armatimonadetes bacterium]|nr:CCA tRNA nucleotidyltransferase [Armatimonadota bacterium]
MNADVTAEDLWGRMSPASRSLCRRVAETAEGLGLPLYLVGGSVRDLLLGAGEFDLDFAVEGDGPALAREVARRLGGWVEGPSQFLTAAVVLPDGRRLDVATTRQETYPEPTKLPVVQRADVRADLRRRDFSVNALALSLTLSGVGELIDPCGGRADLAGRVIRVLHDRSFSDDPTRLIRAARFCTRLGFAMEPATRRLASEAAKEALLERVTGARVREEVAKLLGEPDPGAVLEWLARIGALQQVLPGLRPDQRLFVWLGRAGRGLAALRTGRPPLRRWPHLLGVLGLWGDAQALVARLDLDGEAAEIVSETARGASAGVPPEVGSHRGVPAVALDEALEGCSPARLLVCWLGSGPLGKRRLERYAHDLGPQTSDVNGHDLQRASVAPGPAVGVGLRAARRAKLSRGSGAEEQTQAALAAVDEWRRPVRRAGRRG